ncbi:MAG: NADH-quinone oxidoreductase subunit M [Phycisphaeraceae bacterium]
MKFILNLMIFLPCVGAIACLASPTKQQTRQLALGTTIATFLLSLFLLFGFLGSSPDPLTGIHFESSISWIEGLNVFYRTGVDGLSLPLVVLTTALSILVVLASYSIEKNVNAYMALYLFLLTGMLGVFLSLDMFLFYVFFEVSLLPMYFLIGIWGGPRKEYAAIKFFLYTLAGSICLLIVMLGLFFYTPQATPAGVGNTWNMMALQGREVKETRVLDGKVQEVTIKGDAIAALFKPRAEEAQKTYDAAVAVAKAEKKAAPAEPLAGKYWQFAKWAFWLTLIAFLIKLPGVPFHTWLPDAHVEAPTPISMILAGVLLKMGGYAMMRITWPYFPAAAELFWAAAGGLGVLAIIYGALCAMAQTDWKKLVAYSSVSHMGYVTLGLAVLTRTGFDGAYFQMIAHGITSALMFFLVGVVYERAHHRDLNRFGGLWLRWPKFGGWSLLGFFAGMGLPGLCGFIGEIMVLLGTFEGAERAAMAGTHFDIGTIYTLGILAAFGVVLTAGYILWMFQRVYMGHDKPEYDHYEPVSARENFIMVTLGVAAILFGLIPYLVFAITGSTFKQIAATVNMS